MKNRKPAFTLTEMLVVMGIIILFITAAIPAIRSLSGSTSISTARNATAALVARAREEAVGVQDIRGVLFIIDPGSDRVTGIICQAATLQDTALVGQGVVLLDAVPGRDSLQLPGGVRLQTLFNGTNGTNAANSQTGADDRYLGFNPINPANTNAPYIGGCILFDGNGKLMVRQYGFQMAQPGTAGVVLSNLGQMLNNAYPAANLTPTSGTITNAPSSAFLFTVSTPPPLVNGQYASGTFASVPFSQLGFVLFDYDSFKSQGFSDWDADIVRGAGHYSDTPLFPPPSPVTQGQSEQTEELWIDTHSTPVLINRFNGTLIRAE